MDDIVFLLNLERLTIEKVNTACDKKYIPTKCVGTSYLEFCDSQHFEPIILHEAKLPEQPIRRMINNTDYAFTFAQFSDGSLLCVGQIADAVFDRELANKTLMRITSQAPISGCSPNTLIDDLIYFYDTLLLNMPTNVYWLDEHCHMLGCNKNTLDFLGMKSMKEFVGKSYEELAELASWQPGLAESFKADDLYVIETGQPIVSKEEPPISLPDGSVVYYVTDRVPIRNAAGKIIGVIGISHEVTELKDTQKRLEQAVSDAKAADNTKDLIIQNLRHDWITPFCGVYSIPELLAEDEEDEDKKEQLLLSAESGCELMDHVKSILTMIRSVDGIPPVVRQPVDIVALTEKIHRMYKAVAHTKEITLEFKIDIEPSISNVLSDAYRIERIVMDVLSNAIKFTNKQGRVSLQLLIVEKPDEKQPHLLFIIRDNGIGMTEEQIRQIYEPFYRASPAYNAKYKGAGTGLTTVKRYLDDLSGEILCESVVGEGTTFKIAVPFDKSLL